MGSNSQRSHRSIADLIRRVRHARWWIAGGAVVAVGMVLAAGRHAYHLPPAGLVEQVVRKVAAPVLGVIYRSDVADVQRRTFGYWHGIPQGMSPDQLPDITPFVYEDPQAQFLKDFRDVFGLEGLVSGAASEYEAIRKLGGWVGSQFDHGTDPVVGGDKACEPVSLIEEGRLGSRYWCEIAARLMVHAATSVGLPARIVTASRDGYLWEHAVAEVWSNEFAKWIVVDTDFNLVYEHEGIPLSAMEILLHGEDWKRRGTLELIRIADPKPNIPPSDAIYVYKYIHLDMRTDWCTRELRRGSPAGGDLATWWYAGPELGHRVLSAGRRVDDPATLDWPVNSLHAVSVGGQLWVAAYSPYFAYFEVESGNGWREAGSSVSLEPGKQASVRAVTVFGWKGPVHVFDGATLRPVQRVYGAPTA